MTRLSRRGLMAAGAAGALMKPAVLRAQDRPVWRMVTSWPKNLPGPGLSAQRLASRITVMSAGRLSVEVYAAGELVPALEVLGAVGSGVADLGHTAALYWSGKMSASVFFTTMPFGLTPWAHAAWIAHGGGQELWDELYAPFGVKPFMAGNSGMQMGGWFKREVRELSDLQGLKLRVAGVGSQVLSRLGVLPVLIAPGEIYSALRSGIVDGAEFLGPWSDRALALHRIAPYYYWPGFTKPNGTGECLVNLDQWTALPEDLKAIVSHACEAEHASAYSQAYRENASALAQMLAEGTVELRRWPDDVITAAGRAAEEVLAAFDSTGDLERRIFQSYRTARSLAQDWSTISAQAFLEARNSV